MHSENSNPIITVKNLFFSYNGRNILNDINFDVFQNDFIGIIGPNGGGKTTLIKLILGFLNPNSGNIKVFGNDVKLSKNKIGYVPQYSVFDKKFPIKVKDIVKMGQQKFKGIFKESNNENDSNLFEAINSLGLSKYENHLFHELSGGLQQRCLIARAIVSKPKILILDEPTASVDSSIEDDIYKILHNLNKNSAILLVTHDVGFVSAYLNKIACVNGNLILNKIEDMQKTKMENFYNHDVFSITHKCHL